MTRRDFTASLLHRAIGVSVAIGIAAATPSPVTAQQKVALRVAYIPVITWLPALVAKDEGIFDANGLDVTFTKFPNIVHLPPTLGRQFDLVPTTAPDLLNAVASGLNLAAVAGETLETGSNKSFQVVVRPDSGINSPKDHPVLFPFWIADADWARANRATLKKYVTSLEAACS
jgi:NitT/TauT family transport system substrate-binding protein